MRGTDAAAMAQLELTGFRGAHKVEETGHAGYGPRVVRVEDLPEDKGDDAELDHAADGGGDEGAADAETEGGREDGIEEDEGEGEPDVCPCQMG